MVRDQRSQQYVPSGQYTTTTVIRNQANVGATATLIRVQDGGALHATGQPAYSQIADEGSPPQYDVNACRAAAVAQVVNQLLAEFAVTVRKVSVDPGKTMRIATDYYDGKWTEAKNLRASQTKAFVVLTLPALADRNKYRIVIVRKDQRQELGIIDLVWSAGDSTYGKGFEFNPADIAAKGGGAGTYTLKLYNPVLKAEPLLTRDFNIEAAK
jgi:hypothetical protein